MLLEFKVKNYKSFRDEMCFSMEPAPKQKDLEYSILKQKICNKDYRALSSSVIYGPNAAGKSNIIGAIDTLQNIIRRGNIKNEPVLNKNVAANSLELIPYNSLKYKKPVEFYIKFIDNSILFEYFLKLDLGMFLGNTDNVNSRKIIQEKLVINSNVIFSRDEKITLGSFKNFTDKVSPFVKEDSVIFEEGIRSSLADTDLFLTTGFKYIVSSELANMVINWFNKKLIILYDLDNYRTNVTFSGKKEIPKLVIQDYIDNIARYIGITSNHICYYCPNDSNVFSMGSIIENERLKVIIPSEVIESKGTNRFLNLFWPVVNAFENGVTLLVDEMDNSLHPMILMSIINIFHNDELNTNNAQLIFDTHNPIFLNANLFRRDEIKFVERDDAGISTTYALSDIINPCDNTKVRAGADYMKNYFINKYGAIKDIDLEPLFKEISVKKLGIEGIRVESNFASRKI